MHAGTEYADLQDALLTRCVKSATFLSQRDLTALTPGQIDTVSDPPSVQTAVMVPSDYGAFPNFSIAVLKRKCEQITLLLPFRDDVATSINIWQPFWDINREFSVRISQLGSYKGEPAYLDMERAYFSESQDNGRWKHSL